MTRKILFYFVFVLWGWIIFVFFNFNEAGSDIYHLSFYYGELLQSIIEKGKFESYNLVNTNGVYLTFKAHRLPLIPYFIVLISKIFHTKDTNFISLIKNLIWQIPFYYSLLLVWRFPGLKKNLKILSISFILVFPQVIKNSFTLGMEEGYIISVFTAFFAILLFESEHSKSKYWKLLALMMICYWLKNNFVYIIPFMLGVIYYLCRDIKILTVGIIGYIICNLMLLSFNKMNTGKFTLQYPWKYWNLYKGNNAETFKYYPEYSLDVFDQISPILEKNQVKNEWEFDDFYKKVYQDYVSEHKKEVLTMYLKKSLILLVDIRPTGRFEKEFDKYQIIGMVFMFIFRLIEFYGMFLFLKIFRNKAVGLRVKMMVLSCLILYALYLSAFILAWGIERHISPLFVPVILGFLYAYSHYKSDLDSII